MNIILIGYRGSGKSSVGRKLANQLWKDFADVDTKVREHFHGLAIAEIWRQFGEPAFREMEADVVQQLCQQDNLVIALGGGSLLRDDARQAVRQSQAVRIYLKCSAEVLWQRVKADEENQANRPSLTEQDDRLAEIRTVLAQREPVYEATADHVFDVSHVDVDETVRYLIARFL